MHKILSWFYNSKDLLFYVHILTLKTFEPRQKVTPPTYNPVHRLVSSLCDSLLLFSSPTDVEMSINADGSQLLAVIFLTVSSIDFLFFFVFFLFKICDKAQTGRRCCHSKASLASHSHFCSGFIDLQQFI